MGGLDSRLESGVSGWLGTMRRQVKICVYLAEVHAKPCVDGGRKDDLGTR